MKISTPKALLTGIAIIAMAVLVKSDKFLLATEAKAAVDGRDYRALAKDADLRKAVEQFIRDCDMEIRPNGGSFSTTDILC